MDEADITLGNYAYQSAQKYAYKTLTVVSFGVYEVVY